MSDWPEVPLSLVLTPVKRPTAIEDERIYKQVTVMVKGRGAKLRGEQPGASIGTKRQNTARRGDVVLSKIDARHGAVAVVPASLDGAVVTQDFPLFSVASGDPDFVALLLASRAFVRLADTSSRGTTNRRRLDVRTLLSQKIAFPDADTQRVIAAACFSVRDVCGELERTVSNWRAAVEALPSVYLESLISTGEIPEVPLSDLLTRVKRPLALEDNTVYRRMGLRAWGRGTWERDQVLGKDVGTKNQFIMRAGDFVYSVPGGRSGSFAIVGETEDGCVGTQNFPTFSVSDAVLPEYLVLLCSTPGPILDRVAGKVRGVAQPNVQPTRLLEVAVPVPDLETQASIAAAAQASIAADDYAKTIQALQQTLVDELVTGRITPVEARAKLETLAASFTRDGGDES